LANLADACGERAWAKVRESGLLFGEGEGEEEGEEKLESKLLFLVARNA
jgi:hypothetical protein